MRKKWEKLLAAVCAVLMILTMLEIPVLAENLNVESSINPEEAQSSEDIFWENAPQVFSEDDFVEAPEPEDIDSYVEPEITVKDEVTTIAEDPFKEGDISSIEIVDESIIEEDMVGESPDSKGYLLADNLFYNSTYFNNDLATVCANLCCDVDDLSAYFPEGQVQRYYKQANTGEHVFNFSIGYKTITTNGSKKNLVSIVHKGTSTFDEAMRDWLKDVKHFSFEGEDALCGPYQFQNTVISGLNMFFSDHEGVQDYPIVYLITGYSLGGAGANLLAAKLTNEYGSDKVFAYTFGAIKAIASPSNAENGYDNIFNIYNYYDSWGPHGNHAIWGVSDPYYKFGHTLLCTFDFDHDAFSLNSHDMGNYRSIVEDNGVSVPEYQAKAGILNGGQRWTLRDTSTLPMYTFYTLNIYGTGALSDHSTKIFYKYSKYIVNIAVIQNGITHLGKNQFYKLTDLRCIHIPQSVTSIADDAVINCDLFTTVYFGGTREQWDAISIDYDKNAALANANIICRGDEVLVDEDPTIIQKYGDIRLGDGVTASFDADTGSFTFYSNGGTLSKSWSSLSGIDKKSIKSIDVCGFVYLPNNSNYMFYECENLTRFNLEGFDTSRVTNMSRMFSGCSSLTNLDLRSFDTSNVTNMRYMFYGCESLTNLDLRSFDTSNMTDMGSMFYGCESLTNLDLSSFNTSNVTSMGSMFEDCSSLTNLDLSRFDTSNVTGMSYMFYGCSSLTNLDLSNFDTSRVKDMSGMFLDCRLLKNLDLSSFNTSNVTNMRYMFYGCESLTNLDLRSFDTSNMTDMGSMFYGCESLTNLDLSSFNTSNVMYMSSMFVDCSSLTNLDLSSFNTSNVTNMRDMFSRCESLTNLDLSSFNKSNVTDMSCMFYGCESLTNLDLSSFDTSKVTDMAFMFSGCSSLTNLDLRSFDTSNVTNMARMFSRCSSLTNLDLRSFDTSKVMDMLGMFSDCSSLTNLDLSSFDTSKTKDMQEMFEDCSSLTNLDLSSFDISNVEYTYRMFFNCNNLKLLKTPRNNSRNLVVLEKTMYDSAGKSYYSLDMLSKSITLTAEKPAITPTPTPVPMTSGFSDVQDPAHPYYKAIYWAADEGITKGYSDGTFGINRSCTRGEMMMFLWRYAGKPASKNVSKSPFKDVPKTHTFYKAILWGSQKGITKGYSDGTFGVNRNVSRGECMMFLWRLKGKPSPKAVAKAPFPDVPKSHVFYNAVLWGYQKKITTGFTSGKLKGKFGVNENCSRGQIVTFLYRAK